MIWSFSEKAVKRMRLLAPDKFGGYLIYRFQGRMKVFFDGRSDLYGAEFLKQYARLVQVRPSGWPPGDSARTLVDSADAGGHRTLAEAGAAPLEETVVEVTVIG